LDGNDPRLIDVGIMSKYPIRTIDTHIHEWNNQINWFTFSRDCLECDISLPDDKKIRLFVNHFKSMFDPDDPCNGRKNTRTKRLIQAKRVKDIILSEFPNGDGSYAILGDLNDYLESDGQGDTSIGELASWDKVETSCLERSLRKDGLISTTETLIVIILRHTNSLITYYYLRHWLRPTLLLNLK
jgi:hypothetical protein